MFKIIRQTTFCYEIERLGLLIEFPPSLEPFAEPSCVLIFAENLLARFWIITYCVIEVGGGIIVRLTSFISLFPYNLFARTDLGTKLLYLCEP